MHEDFSELLSIARVQLRLCPDADQVIVVLTEHSDIRFFANHLGTGDEDCFVQLLGEVGVPVQLLVCMWADGNIDLPSMHLRRQLVEANPENRNARMLLQSDSGPMARTIGWSMP